VEAFSKATHDGGYDIGAYEMNSALREAMANPDAVRERFESKEQPVFTSDSLNVLFEFIESNNPVISWR